jgi:hypothetical protein
MMKNKYTPIIQYFFIALSLTVMIACGGKNDGIEANILLPHFDVECSVVQFSNCTIDKANEKVFIGLTKNTSYSCEDLLDKPTPYYLDGSFAYSSRSTMADKGSFLVSTASVWQTKDFTPTWIMNSGTYKVCAFIDFNGNGIINSLEPFHESMYTAGQDFFPIDSWQAY